MAENYKVLAVCGAGLATSTHVAKSLQTGLEKQGVKCKSLFRSSTFDGNRFPKTVR